MRHSHSTGPNWNLPIHHTLNGIWTVKDGNGNEEAERGPHLSEEAETIAVEERGRDE